MSEKPTYGELEKVEFKLKSIDPSMVEMDKHFRIFLDNLPGDVFVHDLEGRYIYANHASCKSTGYSLEELLNMTVMDIDPGSAARDDPSCLWQKLNTGDSVMVESISRRKDDSTYNTEAHLNAIMLEGYPAILLIGRDITKRKLIEEALHESEERFSKIFKQSPVPSSLLKVSDSKITEVNEAWCRLMGFSRNEAIGHTAEELEIVDREAGIDLAEGHYRKGSQKNIEVLITLKGGEKREIISSIEELRIGGEDYFLNMINDVTERKRAEREREKLQEQLIQSQKMEAVGRLAGGVAHDFNNMLSVIIGYTELALSEMEPEEPCYNMLQEILNAAVHSEGITSQLLAFARRQTIQPKVLDLNDTVEGMLKMLRSLIGEDIDLSWQPDTNLWPVKMDPVQIDQILANLCVNARDAIEGVGKIIIETKNVELDDQYWIDQSGVVPGEYVMLTVSDNGAGMTEEVRVSVFEPFFSTKDLNRGTGLGLSTVYGIVKQNQGFINLYSEPGKGSIFKIFLPHHKGKIETSREKYPDPLPHGHGKTILIVEDDLSVLKMTKIMLEKLGYTVLAAEGASGAIDAAQAYEGEIDLLLTDVVMPSMNGKDLAEKVTAIQPNITVLFMSGYTADAIALHGVLKKDVHFIQKPFLREGLARKIWEVLDK